MRACDRTVRASMRVLVSVYTPVGSHFNAFTFSGYFGAFYFVCFFYYPVSPLWIIPFCVSVTKEFLRDQSATSCDHDGVHVNASNQSQLVKETHTLTHHTHTHARAHKKQRQKKKTFPVMSSEANEDVLCPFFFACSRARPTWTFRMSTYKLLYIWQWRGNIHKLCGWGSIR